MDQTWKDMAPTHQRLGMAAVAVLRELHEKSPEAVEAFVFIVQTQKAQVSQSAELMAQLLDQLELLRQDNAILRQKCGLPLNCTHWRN